MAAATQAQGLAQRLRAWLWLLPVRVDDPRLWLRAGLGLLLRWIALQGTWWTLREALTLAVVHPLRAVGLHVELIDRAAFAVGSLAITVSALCTHIEVFALISPLLWDHRRSMRHNIPRLSAVLAAMLLVAVPRIHLAVLLSLQGVPWAWAHDGLLGVLYAVVIVLSLRLGGWLRSTDA